MADLRVLVIDDEPGMRLGVERALHNYTTTVPDVEGELHFAVDTAESGEEGLAKIRAQPPDLVLLDHKLPGISGLDALAALAAESYDLLVIMITAYATIEAAVTATKRGADDFLAKPFTPAELRATIRKAAARLLLARQARRLAQERRQVRFEFVRVLGHELKSPIGAVEGYLNLLQDQTLGADVAAYRDAVDRSLARCRQMRKLIADLLDMTQIESGQKQRQLEALNLRELAAAAFEAVRSEATSRRISLVVDGPDPLPFTGDRGELEMILNNLVSNAVKYNRDGGRVDVTWRRDGERVTLAVADTGIGMSAAEATLLFKEFSRVKNKQTRHILGSGLGLSIVKRLADLYGGEVTVNSQPDVGSTFTVTLRDAPPAAG